MDEQEPDQGAGGRSTDEFAAAAVKRAAAVGLSVATAESLTGGLVCASLTAVPGASAVVRGGVVAYTVEMKRRVLGVDADLLERCGPVHADTAAAMARAAAVRFGADFGVATTGVAGPEPHGGHDVGTVFVAVATLDVHGPAHVRRLQLVGGRDAIRAGSVRAALALLVAVLPPADALR